MIRILRPVFLFCLLCLLTEGYAAAASPDNHKEPVAMEKNGADPATLKNDLLEHINSERSNKNLELLAIDSRLSEAAYLHSLNMARNDFFSHVGSDGSTAAQRVESQGYHWILVAENLSCGYTEAIRVVQEWMDSPEHRKNILNSQAEHIGIGIVFNDARECSPFWTADFASEKREDLYEFPNTRIPVDGERK